MVDLQGVYLNLHQWLREQDFPIDGGLVLSRFAFAQFRSVFTGIKEKILKSRDSFTFDFDALIAQIKKAGNGGNVTLPNSIEKLKYLNIIPKFEMFYAPAPLEDIKGYLKHHKRRENLGNFEVSQQLKKIERGILKWPFEKEKERYYDVYSDFVEKLKANPEHARSEEGFFNFHVGERGLQTFDEKAVDTRIVIRAMETFYNYGANSICIVSSDQDFIPLHEKAREFGIDFYQADVAKFRTPRRTGKKIKDLGDHFMPIQLDSDWILEIISGACSWEEKGKAPQYTLTDREIHALCKMHNFLNDKGWEILCDIDSNGKVTFSFTILPK